MRGHHARRRDLRYTVLVSAFFSSENDFSRIGGQFVRERDDLWGVEVGGKRKKGVSGVEM